MVRSDSGRSGDCRYLQLDMSSIKPPRPIANRLNESPGTSIESTLSTYWRRSFERLGASPRALAVASMIRQRVTE